MAEDVEVMDAGFSGAAVIKDEVGSLFCLSFCELIIHHSCRAVFPSLIWVFDPSCFCNAQFSLFCFILGLLAYITFMSAV